MKRLLIASAISLIATTSLAQVSQTGTVTVGGQTVSPTPTTGFNQACNGGSGGIIGQAYSGIVCAAPLEASAPSGVTSVTGSIASATQSTTFVPMAGRIFNVSLSGTWSGSCQLERQLGSGWFPLTVSAAGSVIQAEYWTVNASDQWVEGEASVNYRINCAASVTGGGYVSGTMNYRFDQ